MIITSAAFSRGGKIPWHYCAPGGNELPPIEFASVPAEAESLALIFESPDSPPGPTTHWLAWNIPADTQQIDAVHLPEGIVLGMDTFGKIGYTGPAPAEGRPRFCFCAFALDRMLDLQRGATRQALEAAMQGHILASAELSGFAERPESEE